MRAVPKQLYKTEGKQENNGKPNKNRVLYNHRGKPKATVTTVAKMYLIINAYFAMQCILHYFQYSQKEQLKDCSGVTHLLGLNPVTSHSEKVKDESELLPSQILQLKTTEGTTDRMCVFIFPCKTQS